MAKKADADVTPKDSQTKTDEALSAGYLSLITTLNKIEENANGMRRELKEQAELMSANAEDRRRAQDTLLYNMNMERQQTLDKFKREDDEREAAFVVRETSIKDAQDEILSMLNITLDPTGKVPPLKVIRAGFDRKMADAEKTGIATGTNAAKKEYETSKKLDEAEASKKLALLEQENKQLKDANTALAKQNAELMTANGGVIDKIKDISMKAFEASGGLQNKAVEALNTAANAGSNRIK